MNKNEWRSYIAKPGRSPTAIAKSFIKLGYVGIPGDPDWCPWAKYLKAAPLEPGRTREVAVDTEDFEITEKNGEVVALRFDPSKAAVNFIHKFDALEYRELIDPQWIKENQEKFREKYPEG